MAVTHRIKRLDVALRVPDQESARDLQQEVSTFCRTDLQELLQSDFDAVAAPDRFIRIDRLELSLPAFRNADELRNKLGERIREALRIQLDDAGASAAVVSRPSSEAAVGETPQRPLTFGAPYQAADVFLHILEHGVTPWHAVASAFDDIVHEVIELLQADQAFRVQLAAVLSGSGRAQRRFILQMPATGRRRIVSLITGIEEILVADIERVLDTLVKVLTRGAGPTISVDLAAREIFFRIMVRHRTIDDAVLVSMLDEVITTFIDNSGNAARRIMDDLPLAGMEMETVLPRRWRQAVRDSIASFAPAGSGLKNGGIVASGPKPVGDKTALPTDGDGAPGEPQRETGADSIPDGPAIVAGRDKEILTQQAIAGEDALDRDTWKEPAAGSSPKGDRPLKARPEDSKLAIAERQQIDRIQTTEALQPVRSAPDQELAGYPPETAERDLPLTDHLKVKPVSSGRESIESVRRPYLTDSRSEPAAGAPWMTPYDSEEFHVNNAGLVLVAPFFGMVFRDLGYLDKGRDFVTAEARIRAVHFSQFLVTSEQHPAECNLMLNKILCGLVVDEPLARFIDLTQPELDAAAEILDSALKHWSALKRTSAPVFQQTFLRHEGILTKESGSWLLRIERTSLDVMIDTLPWTISVIKHPWMKQPVMVEW